MMVISVQIESFHQGVDFSLPVTRAKFEELCLDLFKKTIEPVKQVMGDAGMDISKVVTLQVFSGTIFNKFFASGARGGIGRWIDAHSQGAGATLWIFQRQEAQ